MLKFSRRPQREYAASKKHISPLTAKSCLAIFCRRLKVWYLLTTLSNHFVDSQSEYLSVLKIYEDGFFVLLNCAVKIVDKRDSYFFCKTFFVSFIVFLFVFVLYISHKIDLPREKLFASGCAHRLCIPIL